MFYRKRQIPLPKYLQNILAVKKSKRKKEIVEMLKENFNNERLSIEYGILLAKRWKYQDETEKLKRLSKLSYNLTVAPVKAYKYWKKEKESFESNPVWIVYHFFLESLIAFDVLDHWKTSTEIYNEKTKKKMS